LTYLNIQLNTSSKESEFSKSLLISLQCRRILGGRNLVRGRNIVVAAIFDFMTVEDWGVSTLESFNIGSFNIGKFQHGAFASNLRAQRKRLHCTLAFNLLTI